MSLASCSQPAAYDKYNPSPQAARQALESALSAWHRGQLAGMVADTKPQVHITDAHRKPGQKLEKFQILGEVPGDAPRCFAVKATFSNPAAEERIRFVVIGIDPLWVFRHEDLELLSHWEHKMDPVVNKQEPSGVELSTPKVDDSQSKQDPRSPGLPSNQ